MINENLKLSGQLSIVLKDKAGNVKEQRDVKNLVVNTGLAYIASRMKDTTKGAMSHMALGSGTTAAAATDTDLGTLLGSREALDSTTISGTNNEKVVYVSSFEAGDATGKGAKRPRSETKHPIKKNHSYVTNQHGLEICNNFN